MAGEEEDVKLKFGADTGDMTASMAQIRELLQGLTSPLRAVRDNLGEVAEAFVAAFAVEKVAEFTERMAELGDQAIKSSAVLGMSVEKSTELSNVFQSVGVSAEGAMRPLERIGGSIASALSNSTSQQATAFQALGISMDQVKGHANDTEGMLEILRQSFQRLGDGMNKTNDFRVILGRGFDELIPYLEKTDAQIDELKERTEATGTVMSTTMARALEATGENLRFFGLSMQGLSETVFSEFETSIDGIVKGLTDLIEGFNNMVAAGGALHETIEGLAVVFKLLISAIIIVIDGFRQLGNAVMLFGEEMSVIGLRVGDMMERLMHLDFSGAKQAWANLNMEFAQIWHDRWQAIMDDGRDMQQRIADLFKNPNGTATPTRNGPQAGVATTGDLGKKELEAYIAMLETKRQLAINDYATQVSLMDQELAALQAHYGQDSKEYQEKLREKIKMAQDHQNQLNQIEIEAGRSRVQMGKLEIAGEKEKLDAMAQLGQITNKQKVEALKSLNDQEYQMDLDQLNKELQLNQEKPIETARLNAQIEALEQQHTNAIQKIDDDALLAQRKQWQDFANSINSMFDQVVKGVLQGTQTWKQAFERLAGDMVISFAESVTKMMVQWAIFGNTIGGSGGGGLLGGVIGKMMPNIGGGIASLFSGGGSGGGNPTQQLTQAIMGQTRATVENTGGILNWVGQELSSLAQWLGLTTATTAQTAATTGQAATTTAATAATTGLIPAVVALTAAVVANTTALTLDTIAKAVPMFETGAYSIPQNMLAYIHQGEMIIPADVASAVRDGTAGVGAAIPGMSAASVGGSAGAQTSFGGGSPGGAPTVIFQLSAVDGVSASNFIKLQGQAIANTIANAIRNGNTSLRTALGSPTST